MGVSGISFIAGIWCEAGHDLLASLMLTLMLGIIAEEW